MEVWIGTLRLIRSVSCCARLFEGSAQFQASFNASSLAQEMKEAEPRRLDQHTGAALFARLPMKQEEGA